MAALDDALEELSADGKPESEVVFYPRLEPLVESDNVGMVEALEDLHFTPHSLLVPLDLLRNGLQRDIARDVRRLGGVSMRGCMGGGRGDQEDRCGRGGLGGGCEGDHGRTGGVALVKVPRFRRYVPCHAHDLSEQASAKNFVDLVLLFLVRRRQLRHHLLGDE